MPENEAPTKTLLLERREEQSLVNEGKSVLEDRRDALAQVMMTELREAARIHAALERDLTAALASLRQAAFRHGPGGLRRFAADRSPYPEPGWRVKNYFGTRQLDGGNWEAAPPQEMRWDSSEETARARYELHRLVGRILEISARINNLERLTREFRRAQRKVNALEHIVIPELRASIRGIEFALEELERENMVRALYVKRRANEP